jgi:hypothetical protein
MYVHYFHSKQVAITESSTQSTQRSRAIQRYLVTKILESDYIDDKGRSRPEKVNQMPLLYEQIELNYIDPFG